MSDTEVVSLLKEIFAAPSYNIQENRFHPEKDSDAAGCTGECGTGRCR